MTSTPKIQTFCCPYCEKNMNTTVTSDGITWTKCDNCGAILVADHQGDMSNLISSIKRSIEHIA